MGCHAKTHLTFIVGLIWVGKVPVCANQHSANRKKENHTQTQAEFFLNELSINYWYMVMAKE